MARDVNPTDAHTLAGAYALDALTELERAAFDRHVDGCEPCAAEVSELSGTAARLADLSATEPPPALRASVLAEIGRTPQVGGRRHGDQARTAAASVARWRRWTATSVAAGVLALGAGVATWAVTERRVNDERARAQQVAAVLGAPDARLRAVDANGGHVTVVVSPSRDSAVAVLSGMPDPGPGKAYELWFIRGTSARPAVTLPSGQRDATIRVGPVGDADTFGVSVEKAAGAPQPTHVVGELPLT